MYAGSKKKSKKGKAEQEATEEANDANGGGVGGEEDEETPPPPPLMPRDGEGEEQLVSPDDAVMTGGGWTGMMRQMESQSCNIDINSIRE